MEDDGVLYSLQPRFAASSISLSFSFSPGCPGMNGDASGRRGGGEAERERDLAENTPDDGFGETRSEREEREEDRRREGAIDGYLGRQI